MNIRIVPKSQWNVLGATHCLIISIQWNRSASQFHPKGTPLPPRNVVEIKLIKTENKWRWDVMSYATCQSHAHRLAANVKRALAWIQIGCEKTHKPTIALALISGGKRQPCCGASQAKNTVLMRINDEGAGWRTLTRCFSCLGTPTRHKDSRQTENEHRTSKWGSRNRMSNEFTDGMAASNK